MSTNPRSSLNRKNEKRTKNYNKDILKSYIIKFLKTSDKVWWLILYCQPGWAKVLRDVVKNYPGCLCFGMRIFKSMDFEWSRQPSIMWVGPLQSVEVLNRMKDDHHSTCQQGGNLCQGGLWTWHAASTVSCFLSLPGLPCRF